MALPSWVKVHVFILLVLFVLVILLLSPVLAFMQRVLREKRRPFGIDLLVLVHAFQNELVLLRLHELPFLIENGQVVE